MINDLYPMTMILKEKGLLKAATHGDINEPAKNPGIYIEIDRNNQPVNIEYVPKEDFAKFWKHSKGNFNSFPVIRIQSAIIKHGLPQNYDEIWKQNKNREQKIRVLSELDFSNYNSSSDNIIINEWSKNKLLSVCQDITELEALNELIKRFPKNKEQQEQFYIQLLSLIKDKLTTFEEPLLDLLKDILIGSWKKDKFTSNTQIAFDVYDSYNYPYKVKDKRLKSVLIKELISREIIDNKELEIEVCQLSGDKQIIEKDKYPNPKLPVLGNTYLYSNNKDIPCQMRYGMKSLESFRIGKEIVNEINNAVNFLTNIERENKTWVQVPGSKDKELNLLIAFVEDEPEMDEELAKMFGDSPNYEQEVVKFEDLTEQICSSLNKRTEINPNATVRTLVINKVDDGRKQVIFSKAFNVNSIIAGTTLWKKAANNCPIINYHIKINKEDKIIGPFCPYPGQILSFMKKFWKFETKNGKRELKSEKVPGITLKEIYDVLIPDTDEKGCCRELIDKIGQHSQDLMISIGHSSNRKELFKTNKYAIYDNSLAISILSILLYKLNYYKEDYMHSVAFNIGRLMKLSDLLHREYCLSEKGRKGSLPPQLIGNSIMSTAVEFPNRALNLLQERIRIYKAWADTDKQAKLAKWVVNQMGNVALEISENEIAENLDEAERAQVLLGYLARIENE